MQVISGMFVSVKTPRRMSISVSDWHHARNPAPRGFVAADPAAVSSRLLADHGNDLRNRCMALSCAICHAAGRPIRYATEALDCVTLEDSGGV